MRRIFWVGSVFLFLIIINFFHPFFLRAREATLILAFENDGKGRMFMGEVIDGMTIFDALIASSKAGQVELKYGVGPDGKIMISELDGYDSNSTNKSLAFYLNSQRIGEGLINSKVIKPGDSIEVRLE